MFGNEELDKIQLLDQIKLERKIKEYTNHKKDYSQDS